MRASINFSLNKKICLTYLFRYFFQFNYKDKHHIRGMLYYFSTYYCTNYGNYGVFTYCVPLNHLSLLFLLYL